MVGICERLGCKATEFVVVVAKTATKTTQSVCGAEDYGVAEFVGGFQGFVNGLRGVRFGEVDIDFRQFLIENVAVFGVDDSLHGRADDADVVFFQNALTVERNAAVQCGLPAKRQEDAVGTLFGDNFFDKFGRHGQEINLVRHLVGSLHSGDVWVHEDGLDAFLFECFEGLRAGVVKLACLANFQRSRPQEQHFVDVGKFHNRLL